VTSLQFQAKALPLLAQLAPRYDRVVLAAGASDRADVVTQRQWSIRGIAAAQDETADSAELASELAEVRYDADTGELIYAGMIRGPDIRDSTRSIPKSEAVQAARAWMSKLGLNPTGSVLPVLFPPEKTPGGLWRVWLPGPEAPGGHPLTVQVTLIAATGDFLYAAIAEHSTMPRTYLPQSVGQSSAAHAPLPLPSVL
jgi:hypothetical protein